ncbi:MAG TPA: carboxymuconolactone decarboxylase family protein [Acidobacteriota bacterium]|nr:carboxymuconolactone decarboxylase family protein [Acidobacteriota bacterium]
MAIEELPPFLQKVIRKYPDVWEKFESLGQAIAEATTLDDKTRELVKLGIAVAAGREGAVHSHTRRCRALGWTPEEIYQVGLLAVTTIGWSGAVRALSWMDDELHAL